MAPVAPLAAGVWPKGSVKDVAESLGMSNLSDEVANGLASDVEFRLHQIVEESMKFMRHAKRTRLEVEDVDHALRVRNAEPLWGFASTDTLAFRRTTSAAGNLYFVEDEEIDLSRIIQAQLPPVPREPSYTAHWLAVEGVQPTIPQNPTPAELKTHPAFVSSHATSSQGPGQGPAGSHASVRHHLSRELQLYFERVTTAAFDDADERSRTAGLASLSGDPGLHQVVPYLIQFAAEKVTACLANAPPKGTASEAPSTMQSLGFSLAFLEAVFSNTHLFLEPYLHQILPTVLTCLLSTSFSSIPPPGATEVVPSAADLQNEAGIRSHAASLLSALLLKYGPSYPSLLPRVLKTLLRALVEVRPQSASGPASGAGARWGAALALRSLGREAAHELIVGNVESVGEATEEDEKAGDGLRASKAVEELVATLAALSTASVPVPAQEELEEQVGPAFAAQLMGMDEAQAQKAFGFLKTPLRSRSEATEESGPALPDEEGPNGDEKEGEDADGTPMDTHE